MFLNLLWLPLVVTLGWRDNSSNETKSLVERSEQQSTFVQIAEVPTNVTEYVDADVEPGILYVYRVRAWNAKGFSTYSNEAAIQIQAASVMVEWTDSRNPAGVTYRVYWADAPCAGTPAFTRVADGVTGFSHIHSGLSVGDHCYYVTAVEKQIESPRSVLVEVRIFPYAPTGVKVTVQ